eukprot:COSAG06_NODE_554_length_14368_cov_4.951714_3_plen_1135_part_00
MLIILAALIGQIAASPYTTRSLNLIEFTSLLFTLLIMLCGMSFRVQSTEALYALSQDGMFEFESSTDVLNATVDCDGDLDRSSGLAECKLEHESVLWKQLQHFCIFLVVLMTAISIAVAAENSREQILAMDSFVSWWNEFSDIVTQTHKWPLWTLEVPEQVDMGDTVRLCLDLKLDGKHVPALGNQGDASTLQQRDVECLGRAAVSAAMQGLANTSHHNEHARLRKLDPKSTSIQSIGPHKFGTPAGGTGAGATPAATAGTRSKESYIKGILQTEDASDVDKFNKLTRASRTPGDIENIGSLIVTYRCVAKDDRLVTQRAEGRMQAESGLDLHDLEHVVRSEPEPEPKHDLEHVVRSFPSGKGEILHIATDKLVNLAGLLWEREKKMQDTFEAHDRRWAVPGNAVETKTSTRHEKSVVYEPGHLTTLSSALENDPAQEGMGSANTLRYFSMLHAKVRAMHSADIVHNCLSPDNIVFRCAGDNNEDIDLAILGFELAEKVDAGQVKTYGCKSRSDQFPFGWRDEIDSNSATDIGRWILRNRADTLAPEVYTTLRACSCDSKREFLDSRHHPCSVKSSTAEAIQEACQACVRSRLAWGSLDWGQDAAKQTAASVEALDAIDIVNTDSDEEDDTKSDKKDDTLETMRTDNTKKKYNRDIQFDNWDVVRSLFRVTCSESEAKHSSSILYNFAQKQRHPALGKSLWHGTKCCPCEDILRQSDEFEMMEVIHELNAPETRKQLLRARDMWSLGVIGYVMLFGQYPTDQAGQRWNGFEDQATVHAALVDSFRKRSNVQLRLCQGDKVVVKLDKRTWYSLLKRNGWKEGSERKANSNVAGGPKSATTQAVHAETVRGMQLGDESLTTSNPVASTQPVFETEPKPDSDPDSDSDSDLDRCAACSSLLYRCATCAGIIAGISSRVVAGILAGILFGVVAGVVAGMLFFHGVAGWIVSVCIAAVGVVSAATMLVSDETPLGQLNKQATVWAAGQMGWAVGATSPESKGEGQREEGGAEDDFEILEMLLLRVVPTGPGGWWVAKDLTTTTSTSTNASTTRATTSKLTSRLRPQWPDLACDKDSHEFEIHEDQIWAALQSFVFDCADANGNDQSEQPWVPADNMDDQDLQELFAVLDDDGGGTLHVP